MTKKEYLESYININIKTRKIDYETVVLIIAFFIFSIPLAKWWVTFMMGVNVVFYLGLTYWSQKRFEDCKAIILLFLGARCIQLQMIFAMFTVLVLSLMNSGLNTIGLIFGVVICLILWNIFLYNRAVRKLEKKEEVKVDGDPKRGSRQRGTIFVIVSLWIAFLRIFGERWNINFVFALLSAMCFSVACFMGIGVEVIYNYKIYMQLEKEDAYKTGE